MGTAQLLLLFACLHRSLAAAVASSFSFSFDFSNASSYRRDDLVFEGNASVHDNLVDLTCNSYGKKPTSCIGRVSYGHPVPFYDNTTGEVASFQTRFTFAIIWDNNTMSSKGDGRAFFLACYPSAMPAASGGGSLGLMSSGNGEKQTAYDNDRFIAVEFDTFQNSFDPSTFDHLGIDINSVMNSVNTTSLTNSSLNGSMTATVTFDNTTRMLVADLHFDGDKYQPVQVGRQLADVKTLLPAQVAVGFSAATGSGMELHQIRSWSFNSSLAPPHKRKPREHVWEMYIRGKVMEAADERLKDDSNRRHMQSVAVLGLWCSLLDGAKRPTVQKAMEVLERDEPLPDLNYLMNTSVSSAQQDTYTSSSDQEALMSDGS